MPLAAVNLLCMTVNLEVAEGVGTLRLNRPPMNALDVATQDRLKELAEEATRREDVRAVVIYGGEQVFAAGADIKEMQAMDHAAMVMRARALQDSFTAVARIPKPVVAAVTGYALGGGCELALCADYRIAADNAKLGQPEILLGLIPGAGGTQRLARLIGPSRAKDLIFTGRQVKADEALTLGLVDRVVPAAEVYAAAHAWAARLAKGPAIALRAAKESVDTGLETDIETGLAVERNWFAGLFATEDRERGMRSFVEEGPGRATFR
ncbi:enoyl-CoA hydratase [Streptomyces fumigatiscleroticus]|nr:enoyl-CoA hydratase [Streptomyces fumigatiscleroticus]